MTNTQDMAATSPRVPGLAVDLRSDTLEDARQRLSDLLELDEPVSTDVLVSALNDPLYATHLFASRDAPKFFDMLLRNPPVRAAGVDGQAVLSKFAQSMKSWARAGFRKSPPEVVAARLDACQACPHLKGPKGSLVNRLAKTVGLGESQCGLCGCFVNAKAGIATENCPDVAPDGTTRWHRSEAAALQAAPDPA